MLKLHVFLVDTGVMFTFDMEMALGSVSKLMEAISLVTQIPVHKQVLLVTNGEPLNPSSRVGSYKSAGTETNPIFLFSKSAIESPQPPTSSLAISSASLDEQVEKCLQMPSTYDTLVVRAKLAAEFHLCARELGELCENLVGDQQLQQQGWRAVVSNLDNITKALNAHSVLFKQQYTNFLSTQEHYMDMLDRFDDVISLLSRIPVLSCLLKRNEQVTPKSMVLLDWISSKEQKTSLQTLVTQCKELLSQFDARVPQNLMEEITRVLESSDNISMKEIKGLDERLVSLQQRLGLVQQFVQDQADMAQGFKQNQMRAEHLGDPSVLPDLCTSHQKQLLVLLKNHRQLRDICSLCTKAKDELSANLHARLRWVMYLEHSICNCDSKLLVLHESLKKMKRRLEVFEQVFEAPRMYILAVLEILRRKSFALQFIEWGRSVSVSSAEARSEELEKRSKFAQVFGSHFLQSLFVGLDERPSTFAEHPPSVFDERLPEIGVNDIRLLQQKVPELLVELSLGDSLDQSVYVRERLSQKNLSKLVDPKSNPSLEETLRLRERTGINTMPSMTVSQLQKEISQEDIPIGMTQKPIDWQLGDSSGGMTEDEFEPSSLKTLPGGIDGLHSSQSSDVSDSMFRSAEGLDESSSQAVEVVGVLELSEEGLPPAEGFFTSEVVDGGFQNIAKSIARPIPPKSPVKAISNSPSQLMEGYGQVSRSPSVSPFISVASPVFRATVANTVQSARNLQSDLKDLGQFVMTELHTYREMYAYFKNDIAKTLSQLSCKCDKLEGELAENLESKNKLELTNEDLKRQLVEAKVAADESIDILEERNKVEKLEVETKYRSEIQNLKDSLDLAKKNNVEIENARTCLSEELETVRKEMELLRNKSENDCEAVNSDMKNELSSCRLQIEGLESDKRNNEISISELKESLVALKSINSQLESEQQETFNFALKKVKKEKEKSLKDLQNNIDGLKNELKVKTDNIEQLKGQVRHYEGVNASIMSRLETVEKDSEIVENKRRSEVEALKTELDNVKNELKLRNDKIEELGAGVKHYENINANISNRLEIMETDFEKLENEHRLEMEKTESLKIELEKVKGSLREEEARSINEIEKYKTELEKTFSVEKSELKQSLDADIVSIREKFDFEKSELLEGFGKEKIMMTEAFADERQELVENLEKEKTAILLSCELEKQKYSEELEKQSLSKTSSIEEGIDALEWERLLQKLKELESNNKQLQLELAGRESPDGESNIEGKENKLLAIEEMKKENADLQVKLNKLQSHVERLSLYELNQNIAFKQLKIDDLVMLFFDEHRSNYVVLNIDDTRYFLHPNSLDSLNLKSDETIQKRGWFLAYIINEEYCIAKKVQNRFKLPIGTYFYRIHVRPWTPTL